MTNDKDSIFIVDDDAALAGLLAESLDDLGFAVAGTATSAENGLEAIRGDKPDLVIMDVVLPGGMDGVEACKIVQRELDVPVLLVSGLADEEFIVRANQARPYGLLMKPFKNEQLEAAVKLALSQKRSEDKRPALLLSQEHIKLMQDIHAFDGMERYHGLMPQRHTVLYEDDVIFDLVDNNLVDEGFLTTSCGMETKGYRLTKSALEELSRLGVNLEDGIDVAAASGSYVNHEELMKEDIDLLGEIYHFTKIKRYHGIAPRDMFEENDRKRVKYLYKSGYLYNIRLKGPAVKFEKGYVLTDRAHSLLKHIGVVR